jgi:hypothetical protein
LSGFRPEVSNESTPPAENMAQHDFPARMRSRAGSIMAQFESPCHVFGNGAIIAICHILYLLLTSTTVFLSC